MKENSKLFGFEIIINKAGKGIYPVPFASQEAAKKAAQTFENRNAYKIEWRENKSLATKTFSLEEGKNYLRHDGRMVQLINGKLELYQPLPHK